MRNSSPSSLLLAACLAAPLTLALTLPLSAAAVETAADRLTRIEAETLVLKAREKQLDVQVNIMSKQNDIVAKQQLNELMVQNAVMGDPVIRSIEGIGKTLYATLQLNNGTMVDAQVGEVLSNGMKVVSIRANEVIVQTGKKRRIRLAATVNTPATFNPNFPSAGVPLPPPLPLSMSMGLPPGGGK
ncbi:type IV pilus biogenesis protein PilP [Rugamonas sp. CCM 8940]|uniref:type IV pilus biogenesis protein PilP n=1 Tax=Rugamonas sp. CCM 8940 TaxID=2765359 RepID=UPI0018F3960E|nr:type IV pilus biogenesis protein PilP [Rugamonas sp. CCM 8940]MBJ7311954.1 type IV pilus biogenesis protein PilP [Rugamonas sp. CCM 8940]